MKKSWKELPVIVPVDTLGEIPQKISGRNLGKTVGEIPGGTLKEIAENKSTGILGETLSALPRQYLRNIMREIHVFRNPEICPRRTPVKKSWMQQELREKYHVAF